MDEIKIREVLTALLTDIANQAKADALLGKSNIGSIFDKDTTPLKVLDEKRIKEAIADINRATATKESAARFINALLAAAKVVAAATLK